MARTRWKREYEKLAEEVAVSLLAWERAKSRGENVDAVLSTVLRHNALDPAADLLKIPRMKRRGS